MSPRGTLALLVAALALGGYVWWFEIRGAERKAEAEAAARLFFTLDADSATRLELDTSDGATAIVERAQGEADTSTWRLTAPLDYPADGDAVDRALRALEKLASTAAIDARPEDLEPFGLGAGRKRVSLGTREGEPRTLFLGGNTPVGGGRYVELGGDEARLYIVSSSSLGGLTPSLVELRDKRLLRVATSAVEELTVRAGGTLVVRALKTEAGWALVEPENAPADADKLRRVLDDLALARASGFEDAPKPRAAYGFASPAVELSVRAGEREERLVLADHDGRHWLERGGDPVILAVNERVSSSVPRDFFAYRAKRVQTLDIEQVHALEVAFPREAQTRKLVREGETWKSETAGEELKPLAVEDLLYALAELDATGLETSSPDRGAIGLEPPLATLRALDAKGTLLGEVAFGDPHPVKGLPALATQSPLVWRVANEIGRTVPLSPEAFANLLLNTTAPPTPSPAEPEAPPASP